jgi:branched-chain amino acid transport system substrate-binding protein
MVAANPVAIVGGGIDNETPIVTAAAAAGIPFTTISATSTAGFTNPDSFVFGPGNNGGYNSVATQEAKLGGKSVSLVLISAPGALTQIKAGATPIFANHSIGLNVLLTSPLGQPDMTPTIQAATVPPTTGVFLDEDSTTCIAALNAKGTLAVSSSIRFYADLSCETPAVVSAAGANSNGTYFTNVADVTKTSDPDVVTYNSFMKQYAAGTSTLGFAPQGATGVMDLVRVLDTIPSSTPITAASVKAALQASSGIKLFMGDGNTFTCNGKAVAELTSVCNGNFYLDQYVNGKFKFIGTSQLPPG